MKSRTAAIAAEKELKQEMEPITEEDTPPNSAKDISSRTASQLAQLRGQNHTQQQQQPTIQQTGNSMPHHKTSKSDPESRKTTEVT